jgi:hypothetical protein
VTVRGRTRNRGQHCGEQLVIVVRPNGDVKRLPTWVLEPEAAQLNLRDPPRLSSESLKALRHFVTVTLYALESTGSSAHHDTGAA